MNAGMAVTTFNSAETQATPATQAVRLWLFTVAALVALMVCVGGATRLTESGLSITEWQPIIGAIPPLSHADWMAAFEKYKQIPEYQIINKGMSLAEFKFIFWWEWSHRLLGRVIGVVFAVPLVWFWVSGQISPWLRPRLLGLLALGGVQGGIGWYMVKSGLVDRTDVSQYRLALHLSVALVIFCMLVWFGLRLGVGAERRTRRDNAPTLGMATILAAAIGLQIVLGAFVAGLKAGRTYNTWPLMDGKFIPDGLSLVRPIWLNPFENITTAQFDHRMVAYAVLALALWHAVRTWQLARDRWQRLSAWSLAGAVLLQAVLGIVTLLSVVAIPLGVAHQAGALVVLTVLTWHLHRMTLADEVRGPAST